MGVNPLDIAAPWIFCAFSGYLEVKQVRNIFFIILDSLIFIFFIPVIFAVGSDIGIRFINSDSRSSGGTLRVPERCNIGVGIS